MNYQEIENQKIYEFKSKFSLELDFMKREPISVDEINDFEIDQKLVIPSDFKNFYTTYSNGLFVLSEKGSFKMYSFEEIISDYQYFLELNEYEEGNIKQWLPLMESEADGSNVFLDCSNKKVCLKIMGDDNCELCESFDEYYSKVSDSYFIENIKLWLAPRFTWFQPADLGRFLKIKRK